MSEFSWLQALPAVGSLAGALVGGLGGVVLTHRLNRGKHAREKLWERRVEAYSEVVIALNNASTKTKTVLDYYKGDVYQTNQSEHVASLESAAWSDFNSTLKLFVRNSLIYPIPLLP